MYSPDNYIVVLIVIKYSMLTYSEFKACRLSHKIENCLNKGHKALSERSESNVDCFHNCINELEVPNYRLLFLIFWSSSGFNYDYRSTFRVKHMS